MVLQERMCSTNMAKGEGVVPYLTRLTQIKDELGAVGSKTWDEELVRIALNAFSKPWDTFVKGVVDREKLPDWQRLWDDFVQEETRMGQCLGSSSSAPQIVDEEALSLARKGKGKAKKKKGGKKNTDMSKVKCFICHKQGHFASQCPDRKKNNNTQMACSAEVEEFSKNFDEDFCLIACMASTIGNNVWYVDSGASCHMKGHKRLFKSLQEGGLNLHIEL